MAEASSIVTSDSRKTVYGVCVVSVKIHVFSPTHIQFSDLFWKLIPMKSVGLCMQGLSHLRPVASS